MKSLDLMLIYIVLALYSGDYFSPNLLCRLREVVKCSVLNNSACCLEFKREKRGNIKTERIFLTRVQGSYLFQRVGEERNFLHALLAEGIAAVYLYCQL